MVKPAPERPKENKSKQPDEEEIKNFINKGGKVSEESVPEPKEEKEKWTMISVRLPVWMLKEIDEKTDKRPGLSRNAWILESFQERLKEE